MSGFDPGCVKTHTVAKCRKNNSPGRHHASRVQYDLTLRYAIPSRSFYARSKGWSFYTAKTHSRHDQDRNPAVQQSTAVSDVLSFRLSTAGGHLEADRITLRFVALALLQSRLCYTFVSALSCITRSCSSLALLTRYLNSRPLCGSCLVTS
jgi:hypothetical protein